VSRKDQKKVIPDSSRPNNGANDNTQEQEQSGLRVYGQWMEGISRKDLATKMLGTHFPDLIWFM
jgi:hypothetical protein